MLDIMRDIQVPGYGAEVTPGPADDYERVRRIIAFISQRWRDQPSIDDIAEAVDLSATQVHHLFRRWCGLTPKAFLAALTLDHAKALLLGSAFECIGLPIETSIEPRGSPPGPKAYPSLLFKSVLLETVRSA